MTCTCIFSLLVGDHSWSKNLAQCEEDLQYISDLPGRKILFLQNNYYSYKDYALVGTKGYTFEGPFYLDRYGNVCGWDEAEAEHAEKLVGREIERLKISFEAAKADGFRKFIMFLHYPPTNVLQTNSAFTKMAEKYGVEQVIYGHCLRWHPMKVLE